MKEKPGNGLPKIQQNVGEKELLPTKETPELVETFQKKNLYERLGLETTATFEQVSNAYKELKTHYGADSFPQIFKLIHEAAALLTDAVHRGRYNKENSILDNQYPYIPDQEAESYRKKHHMNFKFANEVEGIKNTVGKTKEAIYCETLLSFKEHIRLELDFSITTLSRIKIEIKDLSENGFKIEDIMTFVESIVKEYFFKYVREKIEILVNNNHKDLDLHIDGIEGTLSSLETLGIVRSRVFEPIENLLFVYMDEYIESKIKDQEQAAIFLINNFIGKLTKIGIPIEDIKRNILEANYRLQSKKSLYEALFI